MREAEPHRIFAHELRTGSLTSQEQSYIIYIAEYALDITGSSRPDPCPECESASTAVKKEANDT